MHHGQTDKMDRRSGLILQGPFHKDGGLIMLFGNSRIKFSEIIWLDSESYGKNQYMEKEYNQHCSVLKEFKNNDS